MGVHMLNLSVYKAVLGDQLEWVSQAFFDLLIDGDRKRPGIAETVAEEARLALESQSFNYYVPTDREAWEVISRPIRIFLDFEFQRLHVLAILRKMLVDYISDQFVIAEEAIVGRILSVEA